MRAITAVRRSEATRHGNTPLARRIAYVTRSIPGLNGPERRSGPTCRVLA
jgi:hypothetical protein